MGGANYTRTPPPISAHNFHTFVCRRQPARAIGTKMHLSGFRVPNEPLHSSFPRRRESRGEGWHQPHPNTSNDQVSFSHLGVPAPAGTSDWYENALKRFSSAQRTPPFVIPAKAGIQRGRVAPTTPKRFQQPDPHFHTLVCRRQPAWAISTELTRAVSHQTKIDPGRTLGRCQIPKATSELQFVRINS